MILNNLKDCDISQFEISRVPRFCRFVEESKLRETFRGVRQPLLRWASPWLPPKWKVISNININHYIYIYIYTYMHACIQLYIYIIMSGNIYIYKVVLIRYLSKKIWWIRIASGPLLTGIFMLKSQALGALAALAALAASQISRCPFNQVHASSMASGKKTSSRFVHMRGKYKCVKFIYIYIM